MRKRFYFLLLSMAVIFGFAGRAVAQTMPVVSDNSGETWYFIRNLDTATPRSQLAISFNGADAVAKGENFYSAVPSMWKVVKDAEADTYGLVCKVEGVEYYLNDAMSLTTTSFTGWKLVSGTSGSVTGWRLEYAPGGVLTAVVHQKNYTEGGVYRLMSTWLGADVASLWSFDTPKKILELNLTKANTIFTNTTEGMDPGKFTSQARTTFGNALAAAQAVYDNESSTAEQLSAAISAVQAAHPVYTASVILPVVSTESTTKWYFLQGTRPANTYLTSTGAGAQVLSKPVIPDDTQLWKFVANTSGTANGLAMVNKVTGEYINANAANNTNIFSVATLPANNLQFIVSDIYTNKVARFWIEHAAGSTPAFRLHAGNTNVLNWTGNRYDNSSWLILDYDVALSQFLTDAIAEAEGLQVGVQVGTAFGQVAAADQHTLATAVSAAKQVRDNAAATQQQKLDGVTAIQLAISNFKAAVIKNPEALLSQSNDNYSWYWIRSTAMNAYAKDKVISAGTRLTDEKFTFEAKTAEVSDAQLFRFELTEDKTKVKNIINKLNDKYMAPNGMISDTAFVANDFTLTLLTDGLTFNIKPAAVAALHAQENGAHMVNWAGGAGTASAWSIDFALESPKVITAAPEVETAYRVMVTEGRIVVEGVDKYEVYSLTGQRQLLNAVLPQGVYIVKSSAFAAKVLVR
jgi:hypothetical protein